MPSAGSLSSGFQVPSFTLSRIWEAWSIGTAKPMPSLPPEALAMAVLMPMARPSRSISGPPELPELIAASVWIRSCSSPIGVGTVRPSALTMPVVTVWLRPNGLPMAIVISPTCTSASAPRAKGFRSAAALLLGPDDGGVDRLVDRHHGAGDARAVMEPERDRLRSTDDVRSGEDQAPLGRNEAGTDPTAGLDLDDRGQEPRGRVRERLVARRDHRGRLIRPARAASRQATPPAVPRAGRRW